LITIGEKALLRSTSFFMVQTKLERMCTVGPSSMRMPHKSHIADAICFEVAGLEDRRSLINQLMLGAVGKTSMILLVEYNFLEEEAPRFGWSWGWDLYG
jgi:hypothetical protein